MNCQNTQGLESKRIYSGRRSYNLHSEQANDEVFNALKFSLYILRSFGLDDFKAYVATKPHKSMARDDWNNAIDTKGRSNSGWFGI